MGVKARNNPRKIPLENRKSSFDEVYYGFTEEEALKEAERCLQCKIPLCRKGCPANNDIPSFIRLIKERNYEKAFELSMSYNFSPSICGRCCPHENQCEGSCVLGKKGEPVNIGALERFMGDLVFKKFVVNKTNRGKGLKVAVIGFGPAGMSAAYNLASAGAEVTVFEKESYPGGLLYDGIPSYRLPKNIVTELAALIERAGATIKYNTSVGKDITIPEIQKVFDAIFIATGEPEAYSMNIEGEELQGVFLARPYLREVNLWSAGLIDKKPAIGRHVVVVGGGNVAMDSIRTTVRLGAEKVTLLYRRSEKEMPATRDEINLAREEGIEFMFLTNPVKIIGDNSGNVSYIRCIRMRLGEPDESGRRRPIPIKGSEFEIEADTIIMAIGQSPDKSVLNGTEIKTKKWGHINVDKETLQTNIKNIYAGGDVVTGGRTVIEAFVAGKKASQWILKTKK